MGCAPDKAHQDSQHGREEVKSRPQALARDVERAEVEDEEVGVEPEREAAVASGDHRDEISADEPHHSDVGRAEVDGHYPCAECNGGKRGEREDGRGDHGRVEEAVAKPEAEVQRDDAKRGDGVPDK